MIPKLQRSMLPPTSGYMATKIKMTLNDDFYKMWKETGVAYSKLLSQNFSGWTEENH
jgi:hypothetical protein